MSNDNKQTLTQITPEEFAACKGDPSQIPRLKEQIEGIIKDGTTKSAQGSEVTDSDLFENVEILGFVMRRLSAGDVILFERVGNPIFDASFEDNEVELIHYMEVLMVLSTPADEVYRLAKLSRDKYDFEDAAIEFGSKITQQQLMESVEQIQELLDEAMTEDMEEGSSGESSGSEKKTTG